MKWTLAVALSVRVWACTVVEGDRILGSNLAAALPAFAKVDAMADFGPAPLAGARREFRPAELDRLARKYSAEPSNTSICFERATQTLSGEALLPLLQIALDDPAATIEIADFTRNALPFGKPEFLRSGLTGSGLWRGRLVFGENRSMPIWARVRVTGRDGEPIAVWHRSTEPEVTNGDKVQVEVTSGGVLLAFEGSAESTAHVGEGVIVRNPANGKRFRATVEAKGKVAVRK